MRTWVRFQAGARNNLFHSVQKGYGVNPASCLSLGIKQPVREAENSPPASGEVKNVGRYTFNPPYIQMSW
jgi:hypothetical protein